MRIDFGVKSKPLLRAMRDLDPLAPYRRRERNRKDRMWRKKARLRRQKETLAALEDANFESHKNHRVQFTRGQHELVYRLAAARVPTRDICKAITNPETKRPIDHATLMDRFGVAITQARVLISASVAQSLIEVAKTFGASGQVAAQKFFLETQCGWTKEEDRVDDVKVGGVLVVPGQPSISNWVAAREAENEKAEPPR